MTISEALISLNSFPIPASLIELVGLERELTVTDEITKTIIESSNYELAKADVYFWLSGHVNIREQDVSISNEKDIKQNFLNMANKIYKKYNDPKYTGKGTYGFIGNSFNG